MIFTGVLLGDKVEFRRVTQNWKEPAFLLPLIDFAHGEISERELLQKSYSPFRLDSAHTLIAMKSLREGKREKAMRHLKMVADKWPFTRDFWAGGILREMERRPDWPPSDKWSRIADPM